MVIISTLTPNVLYTSRHGSGLCIGWNDDECLVASEQSAFCNLVGNYISLRSDCSVVTISIDKNGKIITDEINEYNPIPIDNNTDDNSSPSPFQHWTIKEIYEQYDSSLRAINLGGRVNRYNVVLGGLESHSERLIKTDHLLILGCGTSYYSGEFATSFFKKYSQFNTVQLFDGASFDDHDIPRSGTTSVILISQSGETQDLYRCLEIVKGCITIGVVNVVDSLIARSVDCGVYLNAGKEMGVASTKVFTSQCLILILISIWFGIKRGSSQINNKLLEDIHNLPMDISKTIESSRKSAKDVAIYLMNHHTLFILGKGDCESISKEGALKIKEIGYINN